MAICSYPPVTTVFASPLAFRPIGLSVPPAYLGRKPDLANTPDGMDLLTAAEAKNNFKFLAEARDVEGAGGIVAALHARRCGWM
eukprot:1323011-Amorphochlora_amoeboformis.AAC.1